MLALRGMTWGAGGSGQGMLQGKRLRDAGYLRLPRRQAAVLRTTQPAGHGKAASAKSAAQIYVTCGMRSSDPGMQEDMINTRCEAVGCKVRAAYGYPGGPRSAASPAQALTHGRQGRLKQGDVHCASGVNVPRLKRADA